MVVVGLLVALLPAITLSSAHADEITDQIAAYQSAKADFDSSMIAYAAMKNPKMASYRDVMAARKLAIEARQAARQAILDQFKLDLDKANNNYANARKSAKSVSEKQAINAAKRVAVAAAVSFRDNALALLIDLGPEPTQPPKK